MSESNQEQPARKLLKGLKTGVVVSDKREKTRKVEVRFLQRHPMYGKYVRQRSVLHVHDADNESRQGDTVQIAPCRRLSKSKAWRLVRIVVRAPENVGA
jgi:small subunit ribosomal protein S17